MLDWLAHESFAAFGVCMRRLGSLLFVVICGLLAAGCPRSKGTEDYKQARRAESLKDYDTALEHYQKALNADPFNADYKIKTGQLRFEASQYHVRQGQKIREKGELQLALAEFQKAFAIDPSSVIAEQEVRATLELIAAKNKEAESAAAPPGQSAESPLSEGPPKLMPLSRAPINLKMANDAKIIFETLGKMAGLTLIFDPEYPSRRVVTELNNVSLEQALDIVSLQSKSFWKPITQNIIFVTQDQPTKRRDYEEQIIRTFYLSNTVQPQELTEIVTSIRQILDLKRIYQLNAQNAIIIRDTPDKMAIAEKLIADIDRARPEVIIQVEVLQARLDRLRDLGILPTQSATLSYAPGGAIPAGGSGAAAPTAAGRALNKLHKLSTADYSVTLPGAVATAIMTDSTTRIIQNPEIRSVDGQPAKLKIGDRIPVATGSFQTGVGVGGTGATGIFNPLVNTQFTYIDTGVNIEVTPRVHPNRDISLKLTVDVSSVTGQSAIGGIQQPIISQRKIEDDIRLKEGEVSILGGMIDRTETKTLKGWPGLSKIPFFRYFVSDENKEIQESEILIVLIPRIVRLPEWTRANLRPLSSGSEAQVQVRRESSIETPKLQPQPPATLPLPAAQTQQPASAPAAASPGRLRFEPQSQTLKVGQTTTLAIVVENVQDLFSIPMLLQYNPAVLSVEEVRHGGFLSGGTQEIAIVQTVNKERGQAIISATRQPNSPGVSGNGTLLGLVVRALAPGSSSVAIVQVSAKDSQLKTIPLVSGEAAVQVVP
jgi:general secretion pathway protein D